MTDNNFYKILDTLRSLNEADEKDSEEWYDADGNCDKNGCYDAGGHYYAERDADRVDYEHDKQKEGLTESLDAVVAGLEDDVKKLCATGELSDALYERAFEYYLNTGEMPYGVAKARTGDPYQWVGDQLTKDLSRDFCPRSDMSDDEVKKQFGDDPMGKWHGRNESIELEEADLPDEESMRDRILTVVQMNSSGLSSPGNFSMNPVKASPHLQRIASAVGVLSNDSAFNVGLSIKAKLRDLTGPQLVAAYKAANSIHEEDEVQPEEQVIEDNVMEGKDNLASMIARRKEINDEIDAIVKDGGRVTLTDPLSVELAHLKKKINKAKNKSAVKEDSDMDNILKLSGLYKPVQFVAESARNEEDPEWANSPDEKYLDSETMNKILSGGPNAPHAQINPNNPGDNPMAMGVKAKMEKLSLNLKEETDKIEKNLRAKFTETKKRVAEARPVAGAKGVPGAHVSPFKKVKKDDAICPDCKNSISTHEGLQCPAKKSSKVKK